MMTMSGMQAPVAPMRRSRPEDAAAHITVSNPVQHSEGLNKYTSYRVDVRPPATTPANFPQDVILSSAASGGHSTVLRRYSDFLWLYERLHVERAGAVVPPLPEKQPIHRFSPTFVEERRAQLEKFLRRVAVHPELSDAAALEAFLRADEVAFQAAKTSKQQPGAMQNSMMMPSQYNNGTNGMMPQQQQPGMMYPPQQQDPNMMYQQQQQQPNMMMYNSQQLLPQQQQRKEPSGLKRWFAETKTSMTGDWVRSPDDELFAETTRYVTALDNQMRTVTQQAVALVRKGKEIANGLYEFGLAFNLLGQSEAADSLGTALGKMGETANRLSSLTAEHCEAERLQFEEPLGDYLKLIHAVKLALQRRQEKRLTYSTCLGEVEAKQNSLNKLRAQIGSEQKAYATESALKQAHNNSELAREDFCVVSQRVLREVDRFKREKAEEMRVTVLSYIQLQVSYNRRMEEIWAALIPQLENIEVPSAPVLPSPPMMQPPVPQQTMQVHMQPGPGGMVPAMNPTMNVSTPPRGAQGSLMQHQQPVIHQTMPQYSNITSPGNPSVPPTTPDPSMLSIQYRE